MTQKTKYYKGQRIKLHKNCMFYKNDNETYTIEDVYVIDRNNKTHAFYITQGMVIEEKDVILVNNPKPTGTSTIFDIIELE